MDESADETEGASDKERVLVSKRRIKLFNEVDKLMLELTLNDIGSLRPWRTDGG